MSSSGFWELELFEPGSQPDKKRLGTLIIGYTLEKTGHVYMFPTANPPIDVIACITADFKLANSQDDSIPLAQFLLPTAVGMKNRAVVFPMLPIIGDYHLEVQINDDYDWEGLRFDVVRTFDEGQRIDMAELSFSVNENDELVMDGDGDEGWKLRRTVSK